MVLLMIVDNNVSVVVVVNACVCGGCGCGCCACGYWLCVVVGGVVVWCTCVCVNILWVTLEFVYVCGVCDWLKCCGMTCG